MRSRLGWLASLVCLAALLGACTDAPRLTQQDDAPQTHLIHVTSNGWHTAIVAARAQIVETGALPEADDFPRAAFLEFGWGDREYYPSKEKTIGMAVAAALTPTPSVVHMAGRARPPQSTDGSNIVISVPLTERGFARLVQAIADEFARPEAGGAAEPVSRGLYADSNFYDGRSEFHLFNTCNTWTARTLRAGGVDISPGGIVTADELVERLRATLEGAQARPPR